MARYVTSVATPLSAAEVFAYMADVTHFVEWDPGVKRVLRVAGDRTGVGAAYDLTVQAGGTTVMRYEVKEYEPPRRILRPEAGTFRRGGDRMSFVADRMRDRVSAEQPRPIDPSSGQSRSALAW